MQLWVAEEGLEEAEDEGCGIRRRSKMRCIMETERGKRTRNQEGRSGSNLNRKEVVGCSACELCSPSSFGRLRIVMRQTSVGLVKRSAIGQAKRLP